MRFLGIDPGLRLTGYGCVDLGRGSSEPVLVEAGVLRVAERAPLGQRLRQLHEELTAVLADLGPDRMVVERLFSHPGHVRTSILMGHARGVLLLAGAQADVELDELAATAVKKALTGRGHASKHQVQHAVMMQCGLPRPPDPPDVADAIAIALCAARRYASERAAQLIEPALR